MTDTRTDRVADDVHDDDDPPYLEGFDDDFDDDGDAHCSACGGRGFRVTCPDDLCHGQDECIHGDPPRPCWACNPKGANEDRLY